VALGAPKFGPHTDEAQCRRADREDPSGAARNARNDVAVDRCVLVEESRPALRIAAVGRAAGLLVDPPCDQRRRLAASRSGRPRFRLSVYAACRSGDRQQTSPRSCACGYTISRALPRLTAAMAQVRPTLPIPIFMLVQPGGLRRRSPRGSVGASCLLPQWVYAATKQQQHATSF
jgi:hypothetical protein